MRSVPLAAALLCLAAPATASDFQTASALRDTALNDSTAWNLLESLTAAIGPRPVGSPAAARARDWALEKMRILGFTNRHAEAFAKPSWHRGAETADIIRPYPLHLAIIGLGGSVPTPPDGLEADVVVLKSYAELLAARPGAFKGKIVIVDQPMARTQDGAGYGAAVEARYAADDAAKRGAVAYLTRSISTGNTREPHTGIGARGTAMTKIPAAALGVPDADLLQRLAARGPVRIRLRLASYVDPNSKAWNVSGDIAGSWQPDQVIVVGGHLDSWDPGTGAIDDGAGVAITTAAAALIARLPRHPRRTIRVVLWGSEEQNGSSDAYLTAHRKQLGNIVLAGEADLGSDRPYKIALPAGSAAAPALAPLPAVLAPLSVFVSSDPAQHGGSDIEGLQQSGVPIFVISQDASRYFDYHHSADDTLSVVDRAQLNQNVATWAAFLYLAADSDVNFRSIANKSVKPH
jgi:Zn-dependent M28 family amino/carboxypeptidase